MYVCLCRGVTDHAIRAAIREGACCPDEIGKCTGAGTRCGSCRPEIASILRKELAEQQAAARRRLPLAPASGPALPTTSAEGAAIPFKGGGVGYAA